jgi:hypothetical protein
VVFYKRVEISFQTMSIKEKNLKYCAILSGY